MYVIGHKIFLNPLQVESIEFVHPEMIVRANQTLDPWLVIKMASGKQFKITHKDCKSIELEAQKLAFQIDLANGMDFSKKKEDGKDD